MRRKLYNRISVRKQHRKNAAEERFYLSLGVTLETEIPYTSTRLQA